MDSELHEDSYQNDSLTLRQVWRLVPPPAPPLSGIKRGAPNMRVPVSGRCLQEEVDFYGAG